MDNIVIIAMWSGPRNISTAMMRAFENRADTEVWDEPLYGPYLAATGLDHPGAADVIADQGSDWRAVVERLVRPPAGGARVFYQKHMTHHMLDGVDRGWMARVDNCFLIRDPARVVRSYARRRDRICVDDLGFHRQAELFDRVCDFRGTVPPVVDADDVLREPRVMLSLICRSVGIGFDQAMLAWPAGPRSSDGVWAPHWYESVWRSTGFSPYSDPVENLDGELADIAAACRPAYQQLHRHRIRSPEGRGA